MGPQVSRIAKPTIPENQLYKKRMLTHAVKIMAGASSPYGKTYA
jgi:hypothetical protein